MMMDKAKKWRLNTSERDESHSFYILQYTDKVAFAS